MPTTREDSVLFKEIWRSLHRNGWTSKPPALRSLDTSYRYVKPGCNPDGDDGTDFFPWGASSRCLLPKAGRPVDPN
ncbi:hypothetical protein PF006_g12869 [Phytophthora fragariae]|uniref:Uncharacterized protein n=1 Tax=Phytophthora fragariae TaxID=53985 RepID=A0A6A3U4K5_9STRA|nr:hypothetical protein PF006_g12869 [Phytophthora fragariae]KAE9330305.1 hypothetical protein PF008_g15751 [Phytophthora fragariae]